MFSYKNMVLAYSFQIFWSLIWIILIFMYGKTGMLFFIFGALRPLVLARVPIKAEEIPWKQYYLIAKYAAIITCCAIILFYIIDILFLTDNFLIVNRYKIIGSIVPLFVLIHGVLGFLYLYINKRIAL